MTIFLIYLFTRLDVLLNIAGVVLFFSAMCFIVTVIFASEMGDGMVRKWQRRSYLWCVAALCTILVMPTKRDAAIIFASYGVLQAAQTDTAKRIATKSVEVIESMLDSYLSEKKK